MHTIMMILYIIPIVILVGLTIYTIPIFLMSLLKAIINIFTGKEKPIEGKTGKKNKYSDKN